MLNDVAQRMLVMMDFGVAVPGAIVAANVPRALANLQQALSQLPERMSLSTTLIRILRR